MSPFVWEFVYGRCKKDLNTKADVIIAVTHWFLIERAHFKCLGIGDEVTFENCRNILHDTIYNTCFP